MAGIYLHIPFCKQRCAYCDFYSCTALGKSDRFIEVMERELEDERNFLDTNKLRTIYFGGGTPSVLRTDQIARLLSKIGSLWDISAVSEVTLEANPDDLNWDYLYGLRSAGVNRLSVGIQSFDDEALKLMNRRHNAVSAIESVALAKKAGFDNMSIDLIYGIPGMSEELWEKNIMQAVALEPKHISAYHLTIEEGLSK